MSTPVAYITINKKVKVDLVEDETVGKYLYTDGIGKISPNLAESISKKLKNYDANVFQIRFRGSKGVLCMNRLLPDNTIILRKSMQKFECPSEEAMKILDIL